MDSRSWKRFGLTVAALALMAVPALAQDPEVIPRGSDVWTTTEETYSELNLPAGFFGPDCPPFSGAVKLVGVPVETTPEGALGSADTVVERLEDAVFSGEKASTRIVVRALHFRASDPVSGECGSWDAEVTLAGEQKTTEMTIVREGEEGGYFIAPISVDVVWTFTRKDDGAVQTLKTSNILTSDERTPYSSRPCAKAAVKDSVVLTTSAPRSKVLNRIKVPAPTSNFHPGYDKDCRPVRPCRGKDLDPARHCYQAASASTSTSAE